MRRIFIAVKINAGGNLKDLIFSLRSELEGENIKWIDPDSIHITLAFLGATEEEKIDAVIRLLGERCPGFGIFEFYLTGVGVFKSVNNPRIIWIGTGASDELVRLNEVVNDGLKNIGFTVEDRPFRPHVTIGRVKFLKDPDKMKLLLAKHHDSEIQKITVEEVVLYESILVGPKPVYKPVFTVKL